MAKSYYKKKEKKVADAADPQTALQMKTYIERIEKLTAEKDDIASDIKDVFTEVKSYGLDAPTIRKIIAIRKKDREKAQLEQSLLDLYLSTLGMDI